MDRQRPRRAPRIHASAPYTRKRVLQVVLMAPHVARAMQSADLTSLSIGCCHLRRQPHQCSLSRACGEPEASTPAIMPGRTGSAQSKLSSSTYRTGPPKAAAEPQPVREDTMSCNAKAGAQAHRRQPLHDSRTWQRPASPTGSYPSAVRRHGRALLTWARAGQIGPGYIDPRHPQPDARDRSYFCPPYP